MKFQFAILINPKHCSWRPDNSQTDAAHKAVLSRLRRWEVVRCCGVFQQDRPHGGHKTVSEYISQQPQETHIHIAAATILIALSTRSAVEALGGGVSDSNTSCSASLRWLFYILSEDTLQLPKFTKLVLRFLVQLRLLAWLFDLCKKDTAGRQSLAVVVSLLPHCCGILMHCSPPIPVPAHANAQRSAYLIKVNYKCHRRHSAQRDAQL